MLQSKIIKIFSSIIPSYVFNEGEEQPKISNTDENGQVKLEIEFSTSKTIYWENDRDESSPVNPKESNLDGQDNLIKPQTDNDDFRGSAEIYIKT